MTDRPPREAEEWPRRFGEKNERMRNPPPHPFSRHVEILKPLLGKTTPQYVPESKWDHHDRLLLKELVEDGMVSAEILWDRNGAPAEFLNVVITSAGRRLVEQQDGNASAAQNVLRSTQQNGGITAHTVNITYAASAVTNAGVDPSRKPWWTRTWLVISGAVGFGAAVLKILDYFHSHR